MRNAVEESAVAKAAGSAYVTASKKTADVASWARYGFARHEPSYSRVTMLQIRHYSTEMPSVTVTMYKGTNVIYTSEDLREKLNRGDRVKVTDVWLVGFPDKLTLSAGWGRGLHDLNGKERSVHCA